MNLLASLCHSRGQRAFIGRVCMDNLDICPAYYHDASADESIKATEATISHIQSIDPKGRLIAPTCIQIFGTKAAVSFGAAFQGYKQ